MADRIPPTRCDSDFRAFLQHALGHKPETPAEQHAMVRKSASAVLRAYRKGQQVPNNHAAVVAMAAAQLVWFLDKAKRQVADAAPRTGERQ